MMARWRTEIIAAYSGRGGTIMLASAPANAAAVVTGDLQSASASSFANVVDRVKPAVVAVSVKMDDSSARPDQVSGQMDYLPPQLRDFFKQFGAPNNGFSDRQPSRQLIGQGSGFFISADGWGSPFRRLRSRAWRRRSNIPASSREDISAS